MAINWNEIDWKKATAVLARELGVTKQAVQNARNKHAPETRGGRALNAAEIAWVRGKLLRWENLAKHLRNAAATNTNGLKRSEYEKALAGVENDIEMAKGILDRRGAKTIELLAAE